MKTVVTLRFARCFLITLAHTDTMELAKVPQPCVQVDLQELCQFSFSGNNFSASVNFLGKLVAEILKSHNKLLELKAKLAQSPAGLISPKNRSITQTVKKHQKPVSKRDSC